MCQEKCCAELCISYNNVQPAAAAVDGLPVMNNPTERLLIPTDSHIYTGDSQMRNIFSLCTAVVLRRYIILHHSPEFPDVDVYRSWFRYLCSPIEADLPPQLL